MRYALTLALLFAIIGAGRSAVAEDPLAQLSPEERQRDEATIQEFQNAVVEAEKTVNQQTAGVDKAKATAIQLKAEIAKILNLREYKVDAKGNPTKELALDQFSMPRFKGRTAEERANNERWFISQRDRLNQLEAASRAADAAVETAATGVDKAQLQAANALRENAKTRLAQAKRAADKKMADADLPVRQMEANIDFLLRSPKDWGLATAFRRYNTNSKDLDREIQVLKRALDPTLFGQAMRATFQAFADSPAICQAVSTDCPYKRAGKKINLDNLFYGSDGKLGAPAGSGDYPNGYGTHNGERVAPTVPADPSKSFERQDSH
jgi:hypothetical protein